jgi:hypothetical protein
MTLNELRSLDDKLRTSKRQLGKLLCRHDFVDRHGMKAMAAKQFWRKGGYVLAWLPGGYQLVLSRAGVLYLIKCYVAVPVKPRNKDVIRTMRRAYAYLL